MPRLKNPKAKGSRAERKSKKLLEAEGYLVCKAGGSLGMFDLFAIGKSDVLLVQVKSGQAKMTKEEKREAASFKTGPFVIKILHLWPDYAREPEVHYLNDHLENEFNPSVVMPPALEKDKK